MVQAENLLSHLSTRKSSSCCFLLQQRGFINGLGWVQIVPHVKGCSDQREPSNVTSTFHDDKVRCALYLIFLKFNILKYQELAAHGQCAWRLSRGQGCSHLTRQGNTQTGGLWGRKQLGEVLSFLRGHEGLPNIGYFILLTKTSLLIH